MSAVRRPITLNKVVAFINMPEEALANYKALAEIIRLCSSLLTFRERIISFIHQSAKDFLLGEAAYEVFPTRIEDIH